MGIRLVGKSITLAMRSTTRFIAFTLMYTVLMAWMAYNFQVFNVFIENSTYELTNIMMLVISIVATITLSILYAWIVINYRKREIATLKCIGYTNANIRTIIIVELVWVTIIAFLIVAEVLIHATAVMTYLFQRIYANNSLMYLEKTKPLLGILPIVITLGMFLISQVVGILVMYHKILKLRPIVALRILK